MNEILQEGAKNCVFMTQERYVKVLNEVREAKYKQSRKAPRNYQIPKHYDLIKVGRCKKLFVL
jgi:hypothetical protein